MEIINTHRRIINKPKEVVFKIFETLATKNDKIWPYEKWPAIRFKDGLKVGSEGGHGPIRYSVLSNDYEDGIVFKFANKGFNGIHRFQINAINDSQVEVLHIIKMKTSGKATFYWVFVIRWLHDALIEDAFDKIENQFLLNKKETKYSIWVKFLRLIKSKKNKKYYKPIQIEKG